jgi:hypothetical protein
MGRSLLRKGFRYADPIDSADLKPFLAATRTEHFI